MPTISLPATVADGQPISATSWGNVVKTALERLPRGLMSKYDLQTQTVIHGGGIGTTESLTNIVSTAVATEAGRSYRITITFELRGGQALTSYASARVRRGTGTNGAIHATLGSNTVIYGPTGISDKSGTASRDTITIAAVDAPGAASAQQWVFTLQTDASTVDIYRPVLVTVEDMGVTP